MFSTKLLFQLTLWTQSYLSTLAEPAYWYQVFMQHHVSLYCLHWVSLPFSQTGNQLVSGTLELVDGVTEPLVELLVELVAVVLDELEVVVLALDELEVVF